MADRARKQLAGQMKKKLNNNSRPPATKLNPAQNVTYRLAPLIPKRRP